MSSPIIPTTGLLQNFVIESIQQQSGHSKSAVVFGFFTDKPGKAILLLEKLAWQVERLDESLFTPSLAMNKQIENGQYATFLAEISSVENVAQVKLIHPATDKDKLKYTFTKVVVIEETVEDYKTLTKPFIDSIPAERKEWIYNILDGKKEADRVIFTDKNPENGFVVVLDWNWSGSSVTDLHVMAICNRRDISTVRDLNGSHVPLLKNIKFQTEKIIKEKYSLNPSQLRSYMHYQPSYYHFHVHFTNLEKSDGHIGKFLGLAEVISSLECFPDYFQRVNLCFTIREGQDLAKKFAEKKANF